MQNNGGNIKTGSGVKNSIPKMQSTAVKNLNANNKNMKQGSVPSYKSQTAAVNIHEEDWKTTPSGIKYRENYVGGFRSNYSGNDPMNEGYRRKSKVSNVQNTSEQLNASALSALYNFGYVLLLISAILFVLLNGVSNAAFIPLVITFVMIFLLKKALSKKGCLINLVVYIILIIFLFLCVFNIKI
jgi:hypothetical protein